MHTTLSLPGKSLSTSQLGDSPANPKGTPRGQSPPTPANRNQPLTSPHGGQSPYTPNKTRNGHLIRNRVERALPLENRKENIMARKNRVTVPDGIYHITSRICHKAMLFKPDAVKEKIVKWVFDIADFSGVEIYAWCIMDNHIHLLVHVPRVPERLWLNPDREPAAWAFGMRPPECYPPLWLDDGSGDSPQDGIGDSPRKWVALPRPEVGFAMDDEEMLSRLASLYSKRSAEEIGNKWHAMREKGRGLEVEAEKAKYCRRMYNISQFVKTLKERVAMRFNAEFDHEGCLWQGRFYSGIVENCAEVLSVVAGYIDYNPVKAKLVSSPEKWRHSSWSVALSGCPDSQYCRRMYCKMLACGWSEAKAIMTSVLNDKLPEGVSPEDIAEYYDKYDEEKYSKENSGGAEGSDEPSVARPKYRASQAIRCGLWFFKKGAYIGRTMDFAWSVVSHLVRGFPHAGFTSIKRCRAFDWTRPNNLRCDGGLLAA